MKTRPQAGFTLVEMLIALALTALVALLAMSGTRLAALGLNRVAASAQTLEEQRTLDTLLRREISAAVAPPLANRAPLTGTPQRIEFLSLAEEGGAGLYRVTIESEAGALILSRNRIGSATLPVRTVLASRAPAFAIAYFGGRTQDDPPQWHERWDGSRILPRLVRITLDPAEPPLVVRLWASG
jgi:general secretion pathway protein J